ncbi:MAG: LPS-assembly protein LptD, partial [Alphaproteobacteria bacterium]|nr:LPS-assembly protein LptD [Alphaproteobacteria bacterium]
MSRASPFRVRKFLPGLGLLGLALLCSFASAAAKETPAAKKQGNSPPLVQADRMAYDQQKGIITAAGHVEVVYGGQILHADKIVYDQNSDIVRAEGHISILQPSGEVMFAKQAELTSDMKQGFVDEVQMLFPDNSRLAARDAQRYEGRYLVADYGVYTACNLCAEKPEKPPLWQLKGVRVTHDSETKDVIYRDATLEMDGIPVLFSPYFSH